MKVDFIAVGKSKSGFIREGIHLYAKRIKNYIPFNYMEIPDGKKKGTSPMQQKVMEGKSVIRSVDKYNAVWLLDEKGKQMNSVEFAVLVQNATNHGIKRAAFVAGGAYGFSDEIYNTSHSLLSLSMMTFPHELVRLIFLEQFYRAMTIIRNEPYHHV